MFLAVTGDWKLETNVLRSKLLRCFKFLDLVFLFPVTGDWKLETNVLRSKTLCPDTIYIFLSAEAAVIIAISPLLPIKQSK